MSKHFFHDVARSERYFTATLLPHLLMVNGFEGTKLLFKYVFQDDKINEKDDFEIVTELDPVRDGSVYNSDIKKIYKEFGRIAVPDIFIRWGTKILAIEAKFFTQPSADELNYQLKLQRDALSAIISSTNYNLSDIQQCLLMINPPDDKINSNIKTLTWTEIVELLTKHNIHLLSKDCEYALTNLSNSIIRAHKELAVISNIIFTKVKNIDDLITKMPDFIKSGKIWVGFSEGISLANIDLDYLVNRNHYKVADAQYTSNWIRIDVLISKYISLKFKN
jgi:hypothetical protein